MEPASDDVAALKQLSLDELLGLEVTSVSKRPERLLDAAAAIEVITAEDIRRSGATSLPQALRLAPNLAVAQKGAVTWGISARGFNTDLANKMLVLIDGRAVYTPLYSGVFWERQDYLLADLDRIEVISGPGGALWGANAVNGVINITSRSAHETQGLLVKGGGGNELRAFGAVRYGGEAAPGVHYRVYGKYAERDGARYASGADAPDDSDLTQGGFRLDAATGGGELTLQGDLYELHQGVPAGGEATESGHNLLGRWTRARDDGGRVALQVYYDHTHLATPVEAFVAGGMELAPAGTFGDDLDTFDVDFQHSFAAGDRQHVTWGLGYRFTHDVVENAPALGFFPARLDQSLFSGFVQDQVRLGERLFLTLGTKLEHNDYTGFEWEPAATLRWSINPRQRLWFAVSRAVRMPSRIDRDVSQATPPYFVLLTGGPDFASETLVAYELGYRAQLNPALSASVTLFYNDYDDIRSTSLSPATLFPLFFANNLEGRTRGLEASLAWQVTTNWRLQGGYNFLDTDLRVKPGQFDFNQALNETADPRHQVSLHSFLTLPHGWELDAAWRWVDDLIINNAGAPASVPAYAELDVRLGWQASPALEFSLVGQNLLHPHHPEYGVPGPTRREIERSVHAQVSWRF